MYIQWGPPSTALAETISDKIISVGDECQPEAKAVRLQNVRALPCVWDDILGQLLAPDGLHLVAGSFTARLAAKVTGDFIETRRKLLNR